MLMSRNNCEFGAGVCHLDACPCGLWVEQTAARKTLKKLLNLSNDLTNWEVDFIECCSHQSVLNLREQIKIQEIYDERT